MSGDNYGKLVSARTRCADQIRTHADLLSIFTGVGGSADDLQLIGDAGRKAEAYSAIQLQHRGANVASTAEIERAFVAVQKEYDAVMAVVAAVRGQLSRAPSPDLATLALLDKILQNESALTISTSADGKRKASRSRSHEALRVEIQNDGQALLSVAGAAAALDARGVTRDRVLALCTAAEALEGKLSDRALKKGDGKGNTAAEVAAVKEQKQAWAATSRLLALAAEKDARIAALYRDAVDSRPSKKQQPQPTPPKS